MNKYFTNPAGAKIPYDTNKIPFLTIEDEVKVSVLSVGLVETNNLSIPLITVKEPNGSVCYRLPNAYENWATTCVGFAAMKLNVFPADVIFTKKDDEYYADIL